MTKRYNMEPIGEIRSCYTEKFGIPRQPGLVTAAVGQLEFYPPYNREEMFKGLEAFSHIWVIFIFHETINEGWKPTVRPPRLGGQKRVGLFASRSPHRPNHLGMSVVRLEKIRVEKGSVSLELSGVDLLDRTPVVDIKPYVPYSDGPEDATCGYARMPVGQNRVEFSPEVEQFLVYYQQATGRDLRELVLQTLRNDPRPASQRAAGREFGMLLWNVNVRWRVVDDGFEVFNCEERNSDTPQ
ncbi:tRNA (N6-threonylcarbamoyladenosine(37)-N6)-methyltransferase TrmO [Desulfosediminicola flagellatus]|uniref:tRNA (N6-threonylcarbamoyladenosine(37)-N6)-methyltransferase TrmO n=1 Tax=Desulfosediminicola flagellatus TaxID=2569541 RepID=UPI0010AC72DB|nr:tRNA (N6-threonylcarbamoyladenosine(37)-N6)-methyltransferase TrmO [Desulfosediminicola flagellatus]